MKKILSIFVFLSLLCGVSSCNDYLEVKPLDKISGELLSSSDGGIMTLLAKVYNVIPMEDFRFRPQTGYNRYGWDGGTFEMQTFDMFTDIATRSDGTGVSVGADFWVTYYSNLRQVFIFMETIQKAQSSGVLSAEESTRYLAEAHFAVAYIYLSLARRYGGVPLLDHALDSEYVPGSDNSNLRIPRSTELDTWKYILSECDKAIAGLPETTSDYRATKWAAYALKSRAALHAASLAKYWNKAPLAGDAANQKLVGMDASEANAFYKECIDASAEIINHSGKTLYKPNPANVEEAVKNYQALFLDSGAEEIIYAKPAIDGTVYSGQGHNFDIYFSPAQKNPGFHKFGRYSMTLDLVDLYEDYTDDGTGKSAPIRTRMDNKETAIPHIGTNAAVASIPFIEYDDVTAPFADKDARLKATVITPGAQFAGVTIVMQGGMIKTDGTVSIYKADQEKIGDVTYYSYGGQTKGVDYSGFDGAGGNSDDASISTTGFSVRKYLQEFAMPSGVQASSTTTWIDMRLGEVYLNYAEAVVESGQGDAALAARCINDLRHRAAHKDDIPLTLGNVLKERTIELAVEGQRYWDMIRRRENHVIFNGTFRHGLMPILDLRSGSPKYVFARMNNYYDEADPRTFQPREYYLAIPGTDVNKLVQNPGY